MVDIQHHALRAFEQDAPPLTHLLVEQLPDRLGIGQNLRRDLQQFGLQRRAIRLRQVEADAQRTVMGQQPLDFHVQRGRVSKVRHPDGAAANPVLIGWADAALGGADLGRAEGPFPRRVDILVPGQDQRGVVGQHQALRGDLDALRADAFDLGQEVPGIDHHAVADDRQLAAPHQAGGQQRQLEHLAVNDQRVAGIVAALEADDDIGPGRQPVHDLALALVAPLGAYDHDSCHDTLRSQTRRQGQELAAKCKGQIRAYSPRR